MNNKKNFGTTILLVDNELDTISVLSMDLEDGGIKVDSFDHPILALSNFKPNFYSSSILDINIPNMNGYEFYREIRMIDTKVKVCFLPPPGLLEGVNCFIPKPVGYRRLSKRSKERTESTIIFL